MTLSEQFATMIAMTAMGLWIGISLSTYHRFIRPKRRWLWVMIITDIFFWVLQGLLIFSVLLEVNEGQIRFYIFLALALGYAIYKALFERIYKKLLEGLIFINMSVISFFGKTLMVLFVIPAFSLLKLVFISCKILGKSLLAILLFLLKVVYLPFKWIITWLIPETIQTKVKNGIQKIISIALKLVKRPK
ncbi:spore cortex biosynthesis protein YabQ [Scopulibacillus darangshiensis]|uniref:Spore cortex biosynthesis protein YabQ n=1 Tax=Scopulibacillus darangshiensis TaxID=442528 RepID=A0A4R2NMK5_9BACL|nr:spore cortex biosynthesis protein YabQ [Scopulibacillus darangshiensis]TCP22535.1 spore cortex biosynthesis protein YabQ [Scopulibacillus darangshiensis]